MPALFLIIALSIILGPLVTYAIYASSRHQIGYIPLPRRCLPQVVEALDLKNDSTLIDLGCGDGRVLQAALQNHPKLKSLGIEINPPVAWLARWRLRHYPRARIKRDDLFTTNFSSATHIFTYLNNPTMARLEPKLTQEFHGRLVSCDFSLPHRKPAKTIKIGEPWQLAQTLYIYEYD